MSGKVRIWSFVGFLAASVAAALTVVAANTAVIAVRRGSFLRNYAYRFIELCSPALPERTVRAAVMADHTKADVPDRRAFDQRQRPNGNTLSRDEVKRAG